MNGNVSIIYIYGCINLVFNGKKLKYLVFYQLS